MTLKYMAASVPRSFRLMRPGLFPPTCIIGALVMTGRSDGKGSATASIIRDVIMMPQHSFQSMKVKALPLCPEQLAALPTPRESCEIVFDGDGNKKVMGQSGDDLTEAYTQAATRTLAVCKALGINKAILKSKSPSCGSGLVYDGTFSGKTVSGDGLTAELLKRNGVQVMTESEAEALTL